MPHTTASSPADPGVPAAGHRRVLLSAWASAAEDVDDLPLAARLWDQVPDAAGASGRARAALLTGDPAGGLAVLEAVGAADVPDDGPRSFDHVVALACRAALGRADELARLVAVGGVLPASVRLSYLYALGAAADAAGQRGVADEAWRAVVVEHGVRTPYVLSRFLAAWVQGRDRTDARAAAVRVLEAAHELAAAVPPPWEDALAAEGVVAELVRRGDGAGAALLATAVARTGPRSEVLDALAARHAPRRAVAPRVVPVVVAVAAAVASVALLAHAYAGVAVGALAVAAARRWWRPVVDMTLVDGRVWDGLSALRYDDRLGRARDGASHVRLIPSLLTVAGLVAGWSAAGWWVAASAGLGQRVPDAVEAVVFAMLFLGVPGAALWGGIRLDRLRHRRAAGRRRAATEAAEQGQVATCRCWQGTAVTGRFARGYASEHLVPSAGPPVEVGRGAALRACPLSGMRWLVTTSPSGASTVLLRGPAPAPAAAAAGDEGSGYL